MKKQMQTYETETVEVAKVRRVHCVIRGTAPLLMNVFKEGKEVKKDITPEEACKESLYLFKGEIVEPATHIEKAMEKMATGFKWENKKTYKDLVRAFVTVEPLFIPHKKPKWEVFSTPVVIKATKGRIMRHRPMFPDWELEFDIVVKNPELKLSVLEAMLRAAGEFNGIGDYRPKFGLFMVVKFEPQ